MIKIKESLSQFDGKPLRKSMNCKVSNESTARKFLQLDSVPLLKISVSLTFS